MTEHADPYLDARTATFQGRVADDLLDEIRAVVNRAYRDGYEDGTHGTREIDDDEEGSV